MLDVRNQPVDMGTQEHSVALGVCGEFKVWSWKVGRSRITAQLSCSICLGQHLPSTEQAEGTRAVLELLEIPQAACNQTSCIVSVKQCKETFLPHRHPAAFAQACSENPAEELRCQTCTRRPVYLLSAQGCHVDGKHQASLGVK